MHKKLEELRELGPNWDSYGGKRITGSAISQAGILLALLKAIGVDDPFIVPMSNGGIAFEWHQEGQDLEIEISPEGKLGDMFHQKIDD